MKLVRSVALIIATALSVNCAQAQLLANPATLSGLGQNEFGVYLGHSNVIYDIEKADETGDINRSLLSAYAARGVYRNIDIFAALAYGFDIEDGTGTHIALGAKGGLDFIQLDGINFNWYSQLSVYNEELDEVDNVSVENKLSELLLGAVAVKHIDSDFSVYGGLEVVASSLGEATSKKDLHDDYNSDFNRDSVVGLRLGAQYKSFQMHVGLVNESSFLLGVTLPFQPVAFELPRFKSKPVKIQTKPKPVKTPEPETRVILSDKEKLKSLQTRLKELGYKPGPADGWMGKRTAKAIKKYQQSQKLPITGKPDSSVYKSLGIKGYKVLKVNKPAKAQTSNTQPKATSVKDQKAVDNKTNLTPEVIDRARLKLLQERLALRGYKPGVADGWMGKKTAIAIKQFQKDRQMPETGKADADVLKLLDIE
jgi:peptidoglycan hydrolase-like protein with peptidoglycan-binding domain